jgi:histidinol phosphatase-like PHP family hydrolase
MRIDHDVHVHTFLSACSSDPLAEPKAILKQAEECGIELIGFADHLWDPACPGAMAWYVPQNPAHVAQIREQMPEETGVRVLFGAESEYCGGGKVGISQATVDTLDFVLLPMSHFHMRGFVFPPELEDPAGIGALMVARFQELIGLGLATGVAHPFLPCGHTEKTDDILASISDAQFRQCFEAAAQAGVSIEITTGFFPSLRGKGPQPGWQDDAFMRLLALARDCGCPFHFASDSHSLAGIGSVLGLTPFVDELGLTEDHIHPRFRSDP